MIQALVQTSLARNFAFLLKLLIGIMVAAKYGAEGRGYIAAFIVIPELIAFLGGLSVKEGVLFYFAKRGLPFRAYRNIWIWMSLVQIPLMFLVTFLCLGLTEIEHDANSLVLYFALVPALAFQELTRFALRGLGTIKKYNFSVVLEILVYAITASAFIFSDSELVFVILSQILGSAASILYCAININRERGGYNPSQVVGVQDAYRYGLQVHVFNALNTLQSKFSTLYISLTLTLAELGLFTIASMFGLVLQMSLQGPISTVILPKLVKMDHDNAIGLTSQVTRFVTLIGAAYFFFMVIFGEIILSSLFGQEFIQAYYPMLFIILGMVFKTPMATINCYFKATDMPNIIGKIALYITPIQILLTIILTPIYGILGAAMVTVIIALLFSFMMLRQYRLKTGHGLSETSIIKKSDVKKIVALSSGYLRGNI